MVSEAFVHLDALRDKVEVVTLPFRRDYSDPRREWRSLAELLPLVRAADIVHSHAAKAGVLGRMAARLARRPRSIRRTDFRLSARCPAVEEFSPMSWSERWLR